MIIEVLIEIHGRVNFHLRAEACELILSFLVVLVIGIKQHFVDDHESYF